MKIVFLNPSGQIGGAERSLLNILSSLRKAVPDWTFHLVLGAAGPLVAEVEELGIGTTVLPFPTSLARLGDSSLKTTDSMSKGKLKLALKSPAVFASMLLYIRRLHRLLRGLAPDLVHTNGFKMHVLGILAGPRHTPVIWHIHDYVTSRPVMAKLLRLMARYCAAAIAVSKSVATDLTAACGSHLPIYPVYNGVDLQKFSPIGATLDLDALAGLPPAKLGTIRVGLVATLARWKGHDTFLRALSLLSNDLPVRGYVIGGAIYQTAGSQYSFEELRELAMKHGLADKIGFTGFVTDTAAAMRALDIVVHASTNPEPFGLVIAEAMACGRAVVASNAGGAAEIILAEDNALAHPPGNSQVLAEEIKRLVVCPELGLKLARAGIKTAERQFNHICVAKKLLPLYRLICREP